MILPPSDEWGLGVPATVESLGNAEGSDTLASVPGHANAVRTGSDAALELTFGGTLSLTEHDDNYRLTLDVEGAHYSYPLSILDVWGLSLVTADTVKARTAELLDGAG